MKLVRYWVIQLLGVSKSEANGVLVLLLMLLLLLFIPSVMKWQATNGYNSFKSDQQLLDSLLSKMQPTESTISPTTNIVTKLFRFNPNTVSKEQMLLLGFNNKQVSQISNYRNKNGVFRIKKDLLRIYSIDSTDYENFKSYILLPEHLPKPTFTTKTNLKPDSSRYTKNKELVISPIDINLADSLILKTIYGIGSVLSNRIIKYRDRLGGFVSIEQLDEVYGLKDEPLLKLKANCYINENSSIRKININTVSYDSLFRHVYISKKIANSIIVYRNQHGNYQSINEIKNIHLIGDILFEKIVPYLTID